MDENWGFYKFENLKMLSKKIFMVQKIFGPNIFQNFQSSLAQKGVENQHCIENKSCSEIDFTSSMVLQIFFGPQIFFGQHF